MNKKTISVADTEKHMTLSDCMLTSTEMTDVLTTVKGSNLLWSYVDFAKAIIIANDRKRTTKHSIHTNGAV